MENDLNKAVGDTPTGRQARRRPFVFFGAFLALVLIGVGIFSGVRYYRYRQGYLLPMERYDAYMDIFRNDTYGGATPEETLQLFVTALREGDVEKASLYFMPDDRGSREKWVAPLRKDVATGNIGEVLETFSSAKVQERIFGKITIYDVVTSDGDSPLILIFNGKVWKLDRW